MIKVCMLVDFMAIPTEDDEYTEIECLIKDILECEISFERGVYPHELSNKKVDIYVIDYGGVLPGCESMIASHFRELVNQVENKQNTLFIIWTTMTLNWYMEIIKKDNPELQHPNVIFREERYFTDIDYWIKQVKKWFK